MWRTDKQLLFIWSYSCKRGHISYWRHRKKKRNLHICKIRSSPTICICLTWLIWFLLVLQLAWRFNFLLTSLEHFTYVLWERTIQTNPLYFLFHLHLSKEMWLISLVGGQFIIEGKMQSEHLKTAEQSTTHSHVSVYPCVLIRWHLTTGFIEY